MGQRQSRVSNEDNQRESERLNQLPILKGEPGFFYYGDRKGWCVAATVHRDSDALERSNWHIVTADILRMPDDSDNEDMLADAGIERISNFLVGWVEYLLVRPGTPQATRAIDWRQKLDRYPVADEFHFGELEWKEEWCVRCDGATREDHYSPAGLGCGKFRSEDDADDICQRWRVRGRVERTGRQGTRLDYTPAPRATSPTPARPTAESQTPE
jgi:hypothetical protein